MLSSLPASSVTFNVAVKAPTVTLAGISVNVTLKLYSAVAPGSSAIASPLLTVLPAAVYVAGTAIVRGFSPAVIAKVNLLELLLPFMVTVPPVFATEAVSSIVTDSTEAA